MNPESEVVEVKRGLFRAANPKVIVSGAILIIAVIVIGVILINRSVWKSRLACEVTVVSERDESETHGYSIVFDTEPENEIVFGSLTVSGEGGSFFVSSNDLLSGVNVLHYEVRREGHARPDSVLIENSYTPITLETAQSFDSLFSTTGIAVLTDPGNRLLFMGIDTVLTDGSFSLSFDPDSVLEGYDPDLTPTRVISEPVQVENASGNRRRVVEDLIFCFPRVEIEVTEPWGSYVSRTGSGYTIKGTGEQGVRVNFYGAATGYTSVGWNGTFSKWVAVPEFGENEYTLVASREGFTSDTVSVTIFREMTEDEMIREYKNSCEHVSAEELRLNQSYMIGDRVRVWGNTVEWFSGSWLHLVNGNDHWIADLSGFDRVPRLQGLSFYGWGEVTSQKRSFYTSGGSNVTAPVVDVLYYEVSY